MKKGLDIWLRLHRLLSVLLVGLVLSLSIIPLLHSHNDDQRSLKSSTTTYSKAIEKCEICDFLMHKQQKEFLINSFQALQIPFSTNAAKSADRPVALCKFSLPGFTNKGPPAAPLFA
jgi:hypothetical protein